MLQCATDRQGLPSICVHCIAALQVCVQLCEAYKQRYVAERDAVKTENPEKVGKMSRTSGAKQPACQCNCSSHQSMTPVSAVLVC